MGKKERGLKQSHKPFGEALAEIVGEVYPRPGGEPKLKGFLELVEPYTYESLRRMVAGEQPVTMRAMEGIASALAERDPEITPFYFREYRYMWSAEMSERYPDIGERCFELIRTLVEGRESA